ncbi:MAG TPA: hypothetical protein VGE51_07750 [Fontimonas sp.]
MKHFIPHKLLGAAGLALAMPDVHALAAAPVYPGLASGVAPAAVASLIWAPIVVLLAVLLAALLWLLRSPAKARQPQATARRIPPRTTRRARRLPLPTPMRGRMLPRRRSATPV